MLQQVFVKNVMSANFIIISPEDVRIFVLQINFITLLETNAKIKRVLQDSIIIEILDSAYLAQKVNTLTKQLINVKVFVEKGNIIISLVIIAKI